MKLLLHEASWPLYLPLLREAVRTDWTIAVPGSEDAATWLEREIGDADALISSRLPPELRPAARRLKALLFPGAGVIHDDPQDLPLGCRMCNVFEHEAPIAEYVVMAILMHVTGVRRIDAAFRQGRWEGTARGAGEPHGEAMGKTVGIVGYGHIGQAIALRAEALGMTALHVDREESRDDLRRMIAASDFVVVACPLHAATRGMIGHEEIACMRPGAVLINPARAEIVEEEALYQALRDRRIGGAALDVWYQYPANGHGSRFPFHELASVLVTPHFSAWTEPMLRRRAVRMAENLDRLARGQELERVVLTGTWVGES